MQEARFENLTEPCHGGGQDCETAIQIFDGETDVVCTAHEPIVTHYMVYREDGREHRMILQRRQGEDVQTFRPPIDARLFNNQAGRFVSKFDDMEPFSMGCTVTEEELRNHNKIENGMIRL